MNCSIVIRAFNEQKHIGRLLEGINAQTIREVEVILVDSGSTDATIEVANSYGVKLVQIAPTEFTFGRSLNRGMAAASHEQIVIASAHVYPVYPDWLERLLAPFSDPRVALTYGRQSGSPQSKFSEQQIFQRWYPDRSVDRQEHPFCNNANAAVRRSLWENHPYDEEMTGLEDIAWGKWALSQGHFISYCAEAEVIHVHAETPQGVFNRYRREAMAFKQIFPEAHFNLYDFVRNTSASIGFDLLHAARTRRLAISFFSIFWFRWMQFWGTYQGHRHSSTLTPELRQTFYYHVGWEKSEPSRREVDPIRYNE